MEIFSRGNGLRKWTVLGGVMSVEWILQGLSIKIDVLSNRQFGIILNKLEIKKLKQMLDREGEMSNGKS